MRSETGRAEIALYNQQVIIHSPTMWEIVHTYSSFFVCCVLLVSITRTLMHVLLTIYIYLYKCSVYHVPTLHQTYCLFFSSLICYNLFVFIFSNFWYGYGHRFIHVCIALHGMHVGRSGKSCFDLDASPKNPTMIILVFRWSHLYTETKK